MLNKNPNIRNSAEEFLSMDIFKEFRIQEDYSEFDKLER